MNTTSEMIMCDFWVFGYGSLMWNPGFFYDNAILARISGYHRALCIYSTCHRGTKENPGLVLGLDEGGSCQGMAFHVPKEKAQEAYNYLRAREQPTGVYTEKWVEVVSDTQQKYCALTFIADTTHEQYAGQLPMETMFQLIKDAQGASGKNIDYVVNTTELLRQKHIEDKQLEGLTLLLQKNIE